jgi:hypothetical protein
MRIESHLTRTCDHSWLLIFTYRSRAWWDVEMPSRSNGALCAFERGWSNSVTHGDSFHSNELQSRLNKTPQIWHFYTFLRNFIPFWSNAYEPHQEHFFLIYLHDLGRRMNGKPIFVAQERRKKEILNKVWWKHKKSEKKWYEWLQPSTFLHEIIIVNSPLLIYVSSSFLWHKPSYIY